MLADCKRALAWLREYAGSGLDEELFGGQVDCSLVVVRALAEVRIRCCLVRNLGDDLAVSVKIKHPLVAAQAAGDSAGGHLAALMALTAGDPRYQPGFEHSDCSVEGAAPGDHVLERAVNAVILDVWTGCVDIYGVHDLTDARENFERRDGEQSEPYICIPAWYF